MLALESLSRVYTLSSPSIKTMIGIPLFLLASGIQYDCHAYLASLKKYTIPVHPAFQSIVCPHYTAECLIYIALAVVSAPQGLWFNRTMFAVFVFVFTNLAITASNTAEWYEEKFGADVVKSRWKIVPLIW